MIIVVEAFLADAARAIQRHFVAVRPDKPHCIISSTIATTTTTTTTTTIVIIIIIVITTITIIIIINIIIRSGPPSQTASSMHDVPLFLACTFALCSNTFWDCTAPFAVFTSLYKFNPVLTAPRFLCCSRLGNEQQTS